MGVKTILIAFALAFLCITTLEALDPNKLMTQYGHDVWEIEDGLPQNTVHSIQQTPDGYLWIATQEGLVRYDGVRFTVFDPQNSPALSDRFIYSVFVDHSGDLWIGTEVRGLFRYHGGNFQAIPYTENLELNRIVIDEDRNGNKWIGEREHGLFKIEDGKLLPFPLKVPFNDITSLYVDRNDTLWLASEDAGIASLQNGVFRTYTVKNGLPDDRTWCFTETPDGSFWIGTHKGLSRLEKDGTFTNYLPGEIVRSLYTDRDGNLWVGTNDNGLKRKKGEGFEQFEIGRSVFSLFEDQEGSLWIGLNGGGLQRFRNGKVTTFSAQEGLVNDHTICVSGDSEGGVWVGTKGGGLSRIHNGSITSLTTKDGLSRDSVVAVTESPDGAIWIGTIGGGLNRYKDKKIRVYTTEDGLPSNDVFALYAEPDGTLWIGTRGGGLSRFRDGKFTNYTSKEGLSGSYVWDILQDKNGDLWFASNKGMDRMSAGKIQNVFTGSPVGTIYLDAEGVLWFGTSKLGLGCIRNGKHTFYGKQDGMFDDNVFNILEDNNQNLWMSSNKGLFSVSKKQLFDFAERRISSIASTPYGTEDGMKNPEASYGTGFRTRDGKLWFPTIRGVVIVDPQHLRANRQPPPVVIEEVVVNDNVLPFTDNRLPISIPQGAGRLQFRYTALSFLAPKKMRFRYQLDGFDKTWHDAGNKREATYTNIAPGSYTFRVIASNNDGVWNQTGASLALYLRPRFYQTSWFLAVCVATIIFIAWQVHRYRLRRVVEMERLRTRIAADLHDDIGAGLSQIAIMSDAVRSGSQHADSTSEPLDKIADIARELVDSMGDIVWAVNPGKDRMGDLIQRMRRFASDLLSSSKIEFTFHTNGFDAQQRLGPDFRRHVYLIFKEGVNNIARHSHCSNANISLDLNGKYFVLQMNDDGRGFENKGEKDGHGLLTMTRRASELGGLCEIRSLPGQGTSITARIPLP